MKSNKNNKCRPSKYQGVNKGKRSFKNEDVHSEGRTNGDRLSSLNDISWYKRYPELLEASARIAFPYKPGMDLDLGTITYDDDSSVAKASYKIPGVAAMKWIPSFGRSSKATDPTSIAAREIYSKVRSKYSGSLDADAPDFIMYMGALDSIYSYIGALKRIYRLLDIYTPENYVLPDGLLTMMGMTNGAINKLRAHKADFNLAINQLIRMTKKFAMPASMDMFVRHYWMNDNVYTDRPTPNSQFYVFNQVGFYKYAPQNTPAGVAAAGLELTNPPWGHLDHWNPTGDAVEELYEYGRGLVDALSAWDDCYTISGYLMRAYEGVDQFTVDELPIHDQFNPVYVPEVLTQIENSVGVLASNAQSTANIRGTVVSQDPATNAIIYQPHVKKSAAFKEGVDYVNAGNILNMHTTNPSSDATVIATRLHPVRVPSEDAQNYDIYAATEIPLGWNVLIRSMKDGSVKAYEFGVPQHLTLIKKAEGWVFDNNRAWDMAAIAALSAFDYHPMINLALGYHDGTNQGSVNYLMGDVDNVTVVADEVMFNIHRVCTYSELNAFTE